MATVIRRGDVSSGTPEQAPQPATFTFSDMRSQGDSYVQRVRDESRQVVQDAQAEADAIRKKAEAEGKAAAEKATEQLMTQRVGVEMKTLRPALDTVVAELQASRGEWEAHWRESAVRLAVAIAERLVRRELAADPTIGEAWLTEALQMASGASEVTVRLSTDDYEHLRGHGETLAESMSGIADARYVPDPSVSTGGCRVETRHGLIDQRLETQLDRLTEELL